MLSGAQLVGLQEQEVAESLATLLGMKSSTAVQATIAWFRGKFLEKIKLGSLKE